MENHELIISGDPKLQVRIHQIENTNFDSIYNYIFLDWKIQFCLIVKINYLKNFLLDFQYKEKINQSHPTKIKK